MLACAINLSEGRRDDLIAAIAKRLGASCLDVHADAADHRSVFSLGGEDLMASACDLAVMATTQLDLTGHNGVHPRLGAVDVVPFSPFGASGCSDRPDLSEALAARATFADFVADELDLPCFFYGPERSLPEVRRRAFQDLWPDRGPSQPHPRWGACCVGARPALVAYNLWLESSDIDDARRIARVIRNTDLRSLGLQVGNAAQVSCNLIAPWRVGPAEAFDAVREHAPIQRAELVGLVPQMILERVDKRRWSELDLSSDRTQESRLSARSN